MLLATRGMRVSVHPSAAVTEERERALLGAGARARRALRPRGRLRECGRAGLAGVEFAEEDRVLSAYSTPNDPDLPQQWALYRLGLFTDTPLQRGSTQGAWNRCALVARWRARPWPGWPWGCGKRGCRRASTAPRGRGPGSAAARSAALPGPVYRHAAIATTRARAANARRAGRPHLCAADGARGLMHPRARYPWPLARSARARCACAWHDADALRALCRARHVQGYFPHAGFACGTNVRRRQVSGVAAFATYAEFAHGARMRPPPQSPGTYGQRRPGAERSGGRGARAQDAGEQRGGRVRDRLRGGLPAPRPAGQHLDQQGRGGRPRPCHGPWLGRPRAPGPAHALRTPVHAEAFISTSVALRRNLSNGPSPPARETCNRAAWAPGATAPRSLQTGVKVGACHGT